MSRNLLEIFNRYDAPPEYAEILRAADSDSIQLRADKPQRLIEVTAAFPRFIAKRTLYQIEEEIRQAYQLNMVRICPRYTGISFGNEHVPDLLMETNRRGIVANGFFNHCDYRYSGGVLNVEIPFSDSGVELIYDAKTPQLMEEIVREEFGVSVKVHIHRMENYDPSEYQSSVTTQIQQMSRDAAKAEVEYHRMQQAQFQSDSAPVVDEQEILPRAASIYAGDVVPEMLDGKCRIGQSLFDISSPEYIFGDAFEITPTAIANIDKPVRNIVILGEIFNLQREANRTGDKFDVSFDIFDGNTSIEHRTFGMDTESANELCGLIKNGSVVAMRGYAKRMTRKGKVDLDFTFFYTDIARISKIARRDTAEKKRV